MKYQTNIKALLALTFLLVLLWGCKKESVLPGNTQQSAKVYLSAIMDMMQQHAVYKNQIDWTDFRKQVLDMGQNAPRIEGTYPAIRLALALLKDNGHSSFLTQNGIGLSCDCHVDTTVYEDVPVSPDSTIGYVRIPMFVGTSQESITTYITTIQQTIKAADNSNVKGWIVDLRGNSGGYWGPMLQAVRPILGEGTVGYMIAPDGSNYTWEFNISFVENYHLKNAGPKVAVLTDGRTASAGELIAIAFKGRPNTRSFGSVTYGVSTGRMSFGINGETLQLAIEVMADRALHSYGKEVYPDVDERNPALAMEKAVQWLKQ